MYSIKNNLEKTIIIKKSKFIAKVFSLSSIDDVDNILNKLKDEYSDATHICYAYIIDNNIKFYDDKEPNGTAGMPIYNVLKNNNLNYVLAVVIRYFGGIKLGAGPLTRAYSSSITEVINNNICTLELGYIVEIKFKYDNLKDIKYILKDKKILKEEYDELIKITFLVSDKDIKNIKLKLENYIISFIKVKEEFIKSNS